MKGIYKKSEPVKGRYYLNRFWFDTDEAENEKGLALGFNKWTDNVDESKMETKRIAVSFSYYATPKEVANQLRALADWSEAQ